MHSGLGNQSGVARPRCPAVVQGLWISFIRTLVILVRLDVNMEKLMWRGPHVGRQFVTGFYVVDGILNTSPVQGSGHLQFIDEILVNKTTKRNPEINNNI